MRMCGRHPEGCGTKERGGDRRRLQISPEKED